MRSWGLVFKLAPADWRNLRRDSLLVWMPVLPLLTALLIRWGIPTLTELLRRAVGFELEPFYPLIMGSFVISVAGIVGSVTGFLLLDERDDGVFDALLVTPLSANVYVGYRVLTPLLTGTLATIASYPLCGIVPLAWPDLICAAALGGFSAPFMALYLVSFADNKVTGFALMKLMNGFQVLPVVAYFVPMPWQLVAGIVPSYWPMKIVWLAASGDAWGGVFAAGLGINAIAVRLLMLRFNRIVHR